MSGDSLVLKYGMLVRKTNGSQSLMDKLLSLGWKTEEERVERVQSAFNIISNSLWDFTDIDGEEDDHYDANLRRVLEDAVWDYERSASRIPLGLILRGTFFPSGEEEGIPLLLPDESWKLITCVIPSALMKLKTMRFKCSVVQTTTNRMVFRRPDPVSTVGEVDQLADILYNAGYDIPESIERDFIDRRARDLGPDAFAAFDLGCHLMDNGWLYTARYRAGDEDSGNRSGGTVTVELTRPEMLSDERLDDLRLE